MTRVCAHAATGTLSQPRLRSRRTELTGHGGRRQCVDEARTAARARTRCRGMRAGERTDIGCSAADRCRRLCFRSWSRAADTDPSTHPDTGTCGHAECEPRRVEDRPRSARRGRLDGDSSANVSGRNRTLPVRLHRLPHLRRSMSGARCGGQSPPDHHSTVLDRQELSGPADLGDGDLVAHWRRHSPHRPFLGRCRRAPA